jgi:hypothetical protein
MESRLQRAPSEAVGQRDDRGIATVRARVVMECVRSQACADVDFRREPGLSSGRSHHGSRHPDRTSGASEDEVNEEASGRCESGTARTSDNVLQ